MTDQEPILVLTVATKEQNYTLTALQQATDRLRRRLQDVARSATESASYATLDTTFLIGKTDQIRSNVAEFDTLRDVARWVGCTADQIRAACSPEWVRITHADTA